MKTNERMLQSSDFSGPPFFISTNQRLEMQSSKTDLLICVGLYPTFVSS